MMKDKLIKIIDRTAIDMNRPSKPGDVAKAFNMVKKPFEVLVIFAAVIIFNFYSPIYVIVPAVLYVLLGILSMIWYKKRNLSDITYNKEKDHE